MATAFFAWELGGGLGHMARLLPLTAGLARRGHRVFVALRNLSGAQGVFGQPAPAFLQAPIQIRKPADNIPKPHTFAQILHNVGFGDAQGLRTRVEAWQNLFHLVRPELILCDHSPTALLAAQGYRAAKVTVGSGFFCPPDVCPLPDLRTWKSVDPEDLRRDEDRILGGVNTLLQSQDRQPLPRLSQLYAQVDECILTTVRELDHYRQRGDARYWGAWTRITGKAPQWPAADGRKIFAYLKPFKELPVLLARLGELGHPTIVFGGQIGPRLRRRFGSATMRFESQPLDMAQVGRQCELAILNGNHGSTFAMLMAGVPTLQLPLFMEQAVFTRAAVELGAALGARLDQPQHIIRQLDAMLGNDKYALAARQFAARYADFDAAVQVEKVLDRLEELMAQS